MSSRISDVAREVAERMPGGQAAEELLVALERPHSRITPEDATTFASFGVSVGMVENSRAVAIGAGATAINVEYGPDLASLVAELAERIPVAAADRTILENAYVGAVRKDFVYWRTHYVPQTMRLTYPDEAQPRMRSLLPPLFAPPAFAMIETGPSRSVARDIGQQYSSLRAAMQDHARFVVIGPPGVGKSTAIWRCMWDVVAQAEGPLGKREIPVLVSLNTVRDESPVEELVRKQFGRLGAFMQEYLLKGRLVVLLDALDQVSPRRSTAVVNEIAQLLRDYEGVRLVVSCRSARYRHWFDLPIADLAELDDAGVRTLATAHLGTVGAKRFLGLLDRDYPWLLDMAYNAFFLVMTLQIYANEHERLPENEAELLTTFIDVLMLRELGEDRADDVCFEAQPLELLAYLVQESEGAGASFGHEWARRKIAAVHGVARASSALRLGMGASLLRPDAELSQVEFFHPLLQDCLVARELKRSWEAGADLRVHWRLEPRPLDGMAARPSETRSTEAPPEALWVPIAPPPATNWEDTTILLCGLVDDSDELVRQILAENVLLAGRCAARFPQRLDTSLKDQIRALLLGRMTSDHRPRDERYVAGDILGELGDPRFSTRMGDRGQAIVPQTIEIPAGEFTMGPVTSEGGWEQANAHTVQVDTYRIGRYAVTNAEFRAFVEDGGYDHRDWWTRAGWEWRTRAVATHEAGQPPWSAVQRFAGDNRPAVGVTWFEATAYARWLGNAIGSNFRLPTEAEWEKAARGGVEHAGPDSWPWGDRHDRDRANLRLSQEAMNNTTPVGMFPRGRSLHGIDDLAGNVAEWCSSLFRAYPYNPHDGREDTEAPGWRVLRGGSWGDAPMYGCCAVRGSRAPSDSGPFYGFRVCAS